MKSISISSISKILLFAALVISFDTYSQDDKTVTLIVSGQGNTKDEAKQNALRSAIEQAFGTFVSSKTEILNDELVDFIVAWCIGQVQENNLDVTDLLALHKLIQQQKSNPKTEKDRAASL